MATRFERIYSDLQSDLKDIVDNYYQDNYSEAFGHFMLKLKFGLSDEEANECITDGADDNGIDAIYIESGKTINFFQFKFPENSRNISKGVTENEVLKLCNGVELFSSPEEVFNSVTWNALLKDKRDEFIRSDIYDFKLWIIRYSNQDVSKAAIGKIESFIERYKKVTGNTISYEFLLADACVSLYENNIKNVWPDFKLPYKQNLSPFSDEKANVNSAFVTLKTIYEIFNPIQDKVFEGNVRYLNPNSKINDGIKDTIINNCSNFHLLNNGITIVCTNCRDNTANTYFDITSGTIINGAQTVGTIINTLKEFNSSQLKKYEKSFVFVKIIAFEKEEQLVNDMVYTLNTQNQMKNSYTIANDLIVKNVQKQINNDTEYFLEIKNNEYNYQKLNNSRFSKLSKNKIDIETFIQVFTAFYDINGMSNLAKNSKAQLFTADNIQKIINELQFDQAMLSYKVYLKLMNIIKDYRAYRKNHDKKEILDVLEIEEKNIDDYRFLNTGNIIILYALGILYKNRELDPYKNMIYVIRSLKNIFKKETNISNATKSKETFEKVEKYVLKLKIDGEIIVLNQKSNKQTNRCR